jgi:mRNA interferase MazF
MRRGDLITIAISGDDGKPRPALLMTVPRAKAGAVFGQLDARTMASVETTLARFFGLWGQAV